MSDEQRGHSVQLTQEQIDMIFYMTGLMKVSGEAVDTLANLRRVFKPIVSPEPEKPSGGNA